MPASAIACDRCGHPLPPDDWNREDPVSCASCGSSLRVDVFPAFFRGLAAPSAPEEITVHADAGCFFHPRKRAIVPCDACGRFLCAICDVEFDGRHLCPGCLEGGKKKGKLQNLENSRTLYDRLALALAVYPVLFFYATIVTAPMAFFVSIRYWKAPPSIVGGTKTRFVAAMILALLQIAGWVVLISLLFRARPSR